MTFIIVRAWLLNRWRVYSVERCSRFPTDTHDGRWRWVASCKTREAAEKLVRAL